MVLEIVVPGIYLIWLALAALVTGVMVLMIALPLVAQVLIFAIAALILVLDAHRFLKDKPIAEADPMMNRRGARMVGGNGLFTAAIINGAGRVKLGDSEWIAHGPDMALGAQGRVIGADGAIVLVEPIEPAANQPAA